MRRVRGLIGLTDFDWYTQLAATPSLPEVNFWLPGGHASVKIIGPGDPFFFQLKAPHNAIAGFGTFVRSCPATAAQAWDAFGAMNGTRSHAELLERISYYRAKHRRPVQPGEDPEIGCVLLTEPVFFPRADWVRRPAPASPSTRRPPAVSTPSAPARSPARPGRAGKGRGERARAASRGACPCYARGRRL